MKKTLKKLYDIFWSRLARNIYFLVLFIGPRGAFYEHYTLQEAGIGISLLAIILVPLYINNLLLVPYLLARKKSLVYFPISFAMLFGSAWLYTHVSGYAYAHIKGFDIKKAMWLVIDNNGKMSVHQTTAAYFALFIMLSLAFTICWYVMDYRKKQEEIAEIKKKQAETELTFLKSQLNPHFLFNTLNNLYGLALKKADSTPDAILELSLILRYLLYESNTPYVSFEKEKEIMRAYIQLELLRLSSTDNLTFHISTDKVYNIPPLLWLPILENLFKHGTRYISDELAIEYACTIEQDVMHIHAENYFKPDIKHIEETGGIGLHNLRKRLALLYPGKHEISISQTDNLYITDIKISLS